MYSNILDCTSAKTIAQNLAVIQFSTTSTFLVELQKKFPTLHSAYKEKMAPTFSDVNSVNYCSQKSCAQNNFKETLAVN